ncbi:hypothetical protein TRV_04797 [Trichophyton verrucosum HKI 0517]|uniref:Uncharacterized protein n=1 Tax=Trichophyton verrucosum (strain HKI 0517) TaxID=663202 RepID=D4DCE4_TRIVH|nr:uncharacterized protein TRV_04797 [Trichophyton verrucosum HKI 0517]EFE40466.1 hypothetical protein TRV_04797 [Trichophyton verrucosum HKI 0517]
MAEGKTQDIQLHARNSETMATAAYTTQSTRENKWNVECGVCCVGKAEGGREKKKSWLVFEPTAKKSEELGDERYPAQGWSDLTTPSCPS